MRFPEPKFFGAVTVSDRGQIVIPAQARRELGIKEGDRLLVLSSPMDGIMLARTSFLTEQLAAMQANLRRLVEASRAETFEETGESE